MRKIILLLAVIAAVLCGIAASSLKSRVVAVAPVIGRELGEKIGARVEFGDVSVSLLPFAAEIDDVRLTASNGQPFVVAEKLRFEPKLLSLFLGDLSLRKTTAIGARFQSLRDDRDGRNNSYLPPQWLAKLASIAMDLDVRDGMILLEDSTKGSPRKLEARRIDGSIRSAGDGVLDVALEGAPLGDGSSGRLSARIEPGVGPTGGDKLKVELDVHRGSAEALKGAFRLLKETALRDPVQLSLRAEGLYGERSTEVVPAEPLLGTLRGSVGVVVAGKEERLDLDVEVAVDDTRYQVRGGTGRWGEFSLRPTAWVQSRHPHNLSVKVDVEPFEIEKLASNLGAAERWRLKGRAEQVVLRVTGNAAEPLLRYEMRVPHAAFDAWPESLPIKGGPIAVTGSLLAINTEISASCDARNLEIGTAKVPALQFGVSYWREKLGVTSLDTPLYGGTLLTSYAIYPKTSPRVAGGGLLRDGDAAVVHKNVAPDLPIDLGGRIDVAMQISANDGDPWWVGRVGVHRGRLGGANWAREIIAKALAAAGAPEDAMNRVIVAERPLVGAAEATLFDRIAADVDARGGSISLPRVVVTLSRAQFRGRGAIASDSSIAIDGALWLEDSVAEKLVQVSPAFGRARDAEGRTVLPATVKLTAGGTEISLTPELVAMLTGEGDGAPLAPVLVRPAHFDDLGPLRQQFGR